MSQVLTGSPTITRLSPALGAEVRGLDVSRPLEPATLALVRDAFEAHHLLCFRDQRLTDEQLTAFSLQFGPLEAFPEKDKTKDRVEVYHVANVSAEGEHLPPEDPRVIFQRNNARWHTDSSYRFEPSLASILYGIEVLPDGAEGGETGFSNMFLAYETLPEIMKRRLEPLHQVHDYAGIRRLEPAMPPTTAAERDAFPPVTHPVIRVHPDRGGRRSLYFTCNTSREIGGGTLEEGRALHEWLREHVSRAEFCYYHRWRTHDLVMWDNRCLLHRAIPYDYAAYRRVLRRTTVANRGKVVGPFSVEETSMTAARGFVVPAGGGKHLDMADPGRFAALKLLGRETHGSVMVFEETVPVGTKSTRHLHRDSDEVAWVLAGEITFMIGDDVTVGGPGTCAFFPRNVPHAWKSTGAETGRVLFLYTPAGAGGYIEDLAKRSGPSDDAEREALRARHRWELVGPNPL